MMLGWKFEGNLIKFSNYNSFKHVCKIGRNKTQIKSITETQICFSEHSSNKRPIPSITNNNNTKFTFFIFSKIIHEYDYVRIQNFEKLRFQDFHGELQGLLQTGDIGNNGRTEDWSFSSGGYVY